MTNVYEGATDARQSGDTAERVSRFRPRYRAITDDEKALHDEIKAKAVEMEALFGRVKPGRFNYISNADKVDVRAMLSEILARIEGRLAEAPRTAQ